MQKPGGSEEEDFPCFVLFCKKNQVFRSCEKFDVEFPRQVVNFPIVYKSYKMIFTLTLSLCTDHAL